jgi:DNA-binding IclR family transcriptional regulator
MRPQDPVGPPTVTARVAAILLAIAVQPQLSVTEIAGVVRLPLSTTHRLLSALVTGRVVRRTAQARYELRLDGTRPGHNPCTLPGDISTLITDLADVTGLRVRFGVWHERGVSALSQPSGRRHGEVWPPRRPAPPRRGGRGAAAQRKELLPVHATALGRAMLAFAPDHEVRRVLARPLTGYTDCTMTTAAALKAALATTRSRGMAVTIWEFRVDEWALAVPVFGRDRVIASLEISGTGPFSEVGSMVPTLQYAARTLGRNLSQHPDLLPTGTGRTPLRWLIDPTSLATDDQESQEITSLTPTGGTVPHLRRPGGAAPAAAVPPLGYPR